MQRPLISPDTLYDYSFDYTKNDGVSKNLIYRLASDSSVDPTTDYMII